MSYLVIRYDGLKGAVCNGYDPDNMEGSHATREAAMTHATGLSEGAPGSHFVVTEIKAVLKG